MTLPKGNEYPIKLAKVTPIPQLLLVLLFSTTVLMAIKRVIDIHTREEEKPPKNISNSD